MHANGGHVDVQIPVKLLAFFVIRHFQTSGKKLQTSSPFHSVFQFFRQRQYCNTALLTFKASATTSGKLLSLFQGVCISPTLAFFLFAGFIIMIFIGCDVTLVRPCTWLSDGESCSVYYKVSTIIASSSLQFFLTRFKH